MNFRDVYRQTISDKNWVMPFGKYQGKSIEFVMDANPQYILFCVEKDIFDLSSDLWTEFYILHPWAE